jgi:transcriptional regulator with XRE-family HTH domain
MRTGIFGEMLRHFRTRLGMTQQELADFSTVSVRAIRDLESGRVSRPRKETVRLLAEALRLDGDSRSRLESTVSPMHLNTDGRFASPDVAPPAFGGTDPRDVAERTPFGEIPADEDEMHKVLFAYLPKRRSRSKGSQEFVSYADAVRSLAERLNLPAGPIVIVLFNDDSLSGLMQAGAAAGG